MMQLGECSVLAHVLQRASLLREQVFLCTSEHPDDDQLEAEARRLGVPSFRGHPINKLRRWADAARYASATSVHLLDGDDPFFDPSEVTDSLSFLRNSPIHLLRTSQQSDRGMASVGTSLQVDLLLELARRSDSLTHQDVDTIPWEALVPRDAACKRMPDRRLGWLTSDARLTLDYPEDLQLLQEIAEQLSWSESRSEIERFLAARPDLLKVNAGRTLDFLERQDRQRQSLQRR